MSCGPGSSVSLYRPLSRPLTAQSDNIHACQAVKTQYSKSCSSLTQFQSLCLVMNLLVFLLEVPCVPKILLARSSLRAMAPKERPVSRMGSVADNGNGARARVEIAGRKIDGPQRATRAEARADLEQARQCATRERMVRDLKQLRQNSANVVISQPDVDVATSEPSRKCLHANGAPNTVVSPPAAVSSDAARASSSGLSRKDEEPPSRQGRGVVDPGVE